METYNNRAGMIKDDDDNSIITNMRISTSYPVATLTDKLLSDIEVDETTITILEPSNKLVDINGDDSRYNYLLSARSPYSGLSHAIYYDTLFKDYIVITDPDYFDLSLENNKYLDIEIIKIGITELNKKIGNTLSFGNDSGLEMPDVTDDIINAKLIITNMHGIMNRFKPHVIVSNTSAGGYLNYELNIIPLIELSLSDSVKTPIVAFTQKNLYTLAVEYLGYKEVDKLYIPLPL